MWHSRFRYRKHRSQSQQQYWFITWPWVHYPWRLSLWLLSSGPAVFQHYPSSLSSITGLFKGLSTEANVSGHSFHGDLFPSEWISFLTLAWPEVFLEYKNHFERSLRPLVGKRPPFSLEMKFVNWPRSWRQTPLFIYGVVCNPPPQASGFWQVSLFNLETVKVHGGVNRYSLTLALSSRCLLLCLVVHVLKVLLSWAEASSSRH